MILIKPVSKRDEPLIKAISTRIMSLTYEDVDSGQDYLKLELNNDDLHLFDLQDLFQADAFIMQWGEPGNLTPPRKFRVKEITGFLTWTLKATGEMWSGDQKPVRRLWEEEEVVDIVRKIAAEMGFTEPDIQEPDEMVFITRQQFEPNARFLQRLASEFGYAFWIDSQLHWRSRDAVKSPRKLLVFRGTSDPSTPGIVIGTPTVKFTFTRSRPGKVVGVATENKAESKPSTSEVAKPIWKPSQKGGGPRLVANEYGTLQFVSDQAQTSSVFSEAKMLPTKHEETVYTPSGKPQKAAGKWRGQQSVQSIEVSIVGIGDLSVGSLIELANFGAINDGKWYVRKIVHKQAQDGFTQTLTLSRDSGKKAGSNAKNVPGSVNRSSAVGEKGTAGTPDTRPTETRIISNQYGTLEVVQRKSPSSFSNFVERFGKKGSNE